MTVCLTCKHWVTYSNMRGWGFCYAVDSLDNPDNTAAANELWTKPEHSCSMWTPRPSQTAVEAPTSPPDGREG